MPRFHSGSHTQNEYYNGQHRFEHWYRDNTVYFITARTRDRYPAFEFEQAKLIFWDRFDFYTHQNGFVPWITTLLANHYHTIGYIKQAKPFWREGNGRDYFDGCLRDELQCRRAYRYTLLQSVRAGICKDWHEYPHTHVRIDVDRGVKRALELNAFMNGVRYKRYDG